MTNPKPIPKHKTEIVHAGETSFHLQFKSSPCLQSSLACANQIIKYLNQLN